MSRDYLTDLKGRDVEVNILGRGKLEGREVLIVGESKAQLGKNDVKDFLKRLSRLDTGGTLPLPGPGDPHDQPAGCENLRKKPGSGGLSVLSVTEAYPLKAIPLTT